METRRRYVLSAHRNAAEVQASIGIITPDSEMGRVVGLRYDLLPSHRKPRIFFEVLPTERGLQADRSSPVCFAGLMDLQDIKLYETFLESMARRSGSS